MSRFVPPARAEIKHLTAVKQLFAAARPVYLPAFPPFSLFSGAELLESTARGERA